MLKWRLYSTTHTQDQISNTHLLWWQNVKNQKNSDYRDQDSKTHCLIFTFKTPAETISADIQICYGGENRNITFSDNSVSQKWDLQRNLQVAANAFWNEGDAEQITFSINIMRRWNFKRNAVRWPLILITLLFHLLVDFRESTQILNRVIYQDNLDSKTGFCRHNPRSSSAQTTLLQLHWLNIN